jgi:hypothetical protein
MSKHISVSLILFLAIAYIGFGDQVLPRAVGQYSQPIRTALDDMMVGAFPDWHPGVKMQHRQQETLQQAEGR